MTQHEHSEQELPQLVPVVYARNIIEAEFFKSLLEDHAIPAYIEGEHMASAGLMVRAGGIPIMVRSEDLADAEDVIARREVLDEELDEQFDDEFNIDEDSDDYDPIEEMEELDPLDDLYGLDQDDQDEDPFSDYGEPGDGDVFDNEPGVDQDDDSFEEP